MDGFVIETSGSEWGRKIVHLERSCGKIEEIFIINVEP